ncbi:MAG: hypothetical protein IT426_15125 [Pirellulales bacterium]|nr:hypothetical protein [Pirellulales bacterium]
MTKTVTIQAQQKWEYGIENGRTENSLLVKLNDLGQQGWEAIEILYYKDIKSAMTWTAFLKRPSIGQSPKLDAGPASGLAAKPIPAEPTEEKSQAMKGFDLNGSEFPLKTE